MRVFLLALTLALASPATLAAAGVESDGARAELLRNARFWEARQRDDLAAAALEKLLRVAPGDSEAMLSLGLIRLRQNQMPEAQRWVQQLQKAQPDGRAAQQLSDAYRVATRDRLPWATARRLAESGRGDEAIAALHALFPKGAPPGLLGLDYYRIIGQRADGRAEALDGLRRLAEQNPEDERYRTALADLRGRAPSAVPGAIAHQSGRAGQATPDAGSSLRARAEAALAQGNDSVALQQYLAALAASPDDPWLRFALAKLYVKLDAPDEARALMQEGVRRRPKDDDARYAQALLLMSVDREDEALQTMAAVPLKRRSAGMQALVRRAHIAQARRQLASGDTAAARQLVQSLLQKTPQDVDLLVQAGRIELADHQYETARDYFERARAIERRHAGPVLANAEPTAAESELDRLQRRREGFVTAGPVMRTKPGAAGVSDLSSLEIPVELVLPWGYDGHVFAHADTVRIDAGLLPSVYGDAAFYGKVQAFGPASLANFPNGALQRANGVALGLGYENDDWRFDLGTTPIGFPVLDVVGGIKYAGELAGFSYSADLARRPLTSSLLAYAGARDPVTGATWGGVRSNGFSLWAGRDFGRLGLSFSGGAQYLQGRQVPGNVYLSLRSAVDWAFVDRPDTQLFAGAALTWWHYDKNLSGYTFGQGGYYSPQSYVALSLPVDWRGRIGRWSYRLRPAVSYSVSRTDDSPFYPSDAALQQQAAASTLPSGYTRPVYDGSSGAGIGYSLKAALEYQLLPDYFVGAAYDIDRSEYYAPNVAMLYLRHTFDDWTRPVPVPPRPPKLYSDF